MIQHETCLVCSGQINETVNYPSSDIENRLKFKKIYLCDDCGFGVAYPRLSQKILNEFYDKGEYWSELADHHSLQSAHERNQAKQRVKFVKEVIKKEFSVLDIGAGRGWIVDAVDNCCSDQMRNYHFIEPDNELAEFILKKEKTCTIHQVLCLESINRKYDIIFLNQVLEHVYDPSEFLLRISEHLEMDGFLYIEVPNEDYKFKENVFPHTLFFNQDSLEKVIKKNGLYLEKSEIFGVSAFQLFSFFYKIKLKALSLISRIGKAVGSEYLLNKADDLTWQYHANDHGIWLRLLAKKSK